MDEKKRFPKLPLVLKCQIDCWPVLVIIFGLVFSMLPIFFGFSGVTAAFGVFGLVMRIFVPIHQHYHAHNSVFKYRFLNNSYDFVLSLAGGNLTSVWIIHHVRGHHSEYLNPVQDVEGNFRFGNWGRFTRTVFTALGTLFSTADCFFLLKKSPSALRRKFIQSYLIQITLQYLAYFLLIIIDFKLFLLFIFIPNIFYQLVVFWYSFAQHDQMSMKDVYSSSTTNFKNGIWLLNVGFHTAHHEKPQLHWSLLQQRTEQIIDFIPKECLRF